MNKKIINRAVIGTMLASLLALTGCNTMHGFGKDVSTGGKKLEHAADKNK